MVWVPDDHAARALSDQIDGVAWKCLLPMAFI
jgi:hypothetical protein